MNAMDTLKKFLDKSKDTETFLELNKKASVFAEQFLSEGGSIINLELSKINIVNFGSEQLNSKEFLVIPFEIMVQFIIEHMDEDIFRHIVDSKDNDMVDMIDVLNERKNNFAYVWASVIRMFWIEIEEYAASTGRKAFICMEKPLSIVTHLKDGMLAIFINMFDTIDNIIIKSDASMESIGPLIAGKKIINWDLLQTIKEDSIIDMEFLINLSNGMKYAKFNEIHHIFKEHRIEILRRYKEKNEHTDTKILIDEFSSWYKIKVIYPKDLVKAQDLLVELSLLKTLKNISRDFSSLSVQSIQEEEETLKEKIENYRKEIDLNDWSDTETRPHWVEKVPGPESFCQFLKEKYQLDIDVSSIGFLIDTNKKKEVANTKSELKEKLRGLDETLSSKIIGQPQMVNPISSLIKRWFIGIRTEKPIGSLLLAGPTGVGKTETAKVLAEELFDGNLITLDMSEYQTAVDVSKIIGIAPGYIGYDEGGGLLEKVSEHPRSVILFDELEKAHPKVYDIFLQLLDEGRLTDNKGDQVNFNECLIIATTNESSDILKATKDKFNLERKDIVQILSSTVFRKEFLGRFNDIIYYDELSTTTIDKIFDQKLEKELLQFKNLKDLSGKFTFSLRNQNEIRSFINNDIDRSMGAREIQRKIEEHITDLILDKLVEAELSEDGPNTKDFEIYLDTEIKITEKGKHVKTN